MDDEEVFEKKRTLINLSNKLGHDVILSDRLNGNFVIHSSKSIVIKTDNTLTNLYSFAHELGHVYDRKYRKLFNTKYYRNTYKLLRILDEAIAWTIAFLICVKYRIPLNKFINHSWKCFKTYLR